MDADYPAKGVKFARRNTASECENHGYVTDNLDIGALEEAVASARANPFDGMSADDAEAAVRDALNDIGDECPGCDSRD
ncbi:hypothetical protein EHI42_20655 [Rhizobium hidalgonense]|uniref:hypothetical protein n=1 Tax=Rhizobium hidalgonense TaxID=1538159 RepID=UPI000FEC916A|nr:hypothetical protein [Rhizobium hidalgonense]RWX13449.1 hypothetical protein EHI42_20655 [Rhizobium hidalgonense]